MLAKKYDLEQGLVTYENVKAIRITCSKKNYLIMEDHTPLLGSIDGSILIMAEKEEVYLESIQGYFVHKKNVFELLVKGKSDDK